MPITGPSAVPPELHPENASKVFIDFARAMTLGAAGKQFADLRLLHTPKDELIASASAAGASFSVHISSNRADFSLLLEHQGPPQRVGRVD